MERTASAYFPDGSYLDIAKIEGGHDYKTYMLGLQQDAGSIVSAKYCPFPDRICRYWPVQSTIASNPLAPMFDALVAAAEAALEAKVESASVAAQDMVNIHPRDVALALASLVVESSSIRPTGEVVAQTLGSKYADLPPDPYVLLQHFLSVEYTRTSLTIFLLEESAGNFKVLGKVSSGDFGHGAMQSCKSLTSQKNNTDDTTCYGATYYALRQMCKDTNQLDALDPDFAYNGQWGLDAIFVFGENARDQDLDTVLREILEAVWMDGERGDLARVVEELAPDPAFAGSRAMAFADLKGKRVRQGHVERGGGHDEV